MRLTSTLLFGSIAAVGLTAGQADAALYSDGTPVAGNITIDGNMSDWTGGMVVGTDPDEAVITQNQFDLKDFFMVNDGTYLYGRYNIYRDAISTSDNFNRRVYYIMDTDGNALTGFTYSRFDTHVGTVTSGNERELRMHFANDTVPASDQLYADVDGVETTAPTQVVSDFIAATDGVTGREWRISLADLGITGNTTINYIAFQNFAGDIFGGSTWDSPSVLQSYSVVIPEPASLAMALGVGGLALCRRGSRGRGNA